MPFQNVPVRAPFSKSAGNKCAVFVRTGGLSVTFFIVFKILRHRVNAVLDEKVRSGQRQLALLQHPDPTRTERRENNSN